MRGLSILCGLVLATVTVAQPSFEIPKADGWVTDLAGLMNAGQEQSLEALMESYQEGTGHDIAVLTIPKLPDNASLERYALEVGRQWKLGREGENDGAVLLVVRDDHKVRIEVGRGLEGTLTDSISGRIIRQVIVPQFKTGRFAEGIRAGVEAMHAAVGGDYASIPDYRPDRGRPGGAGCWLFGLFLLLFFVLPLLARIGGGGRGGFGSRRRGSVWPWLMLAMMAGGRRRGGWSHGGGFGGGGGGGFGGFGGGGGFSGGGASGSW